MYKKSLVLVAFLSCLSCVVTAQEEKWAVDPTYFDNIRHTEILLNMTPMLSQFVPFNASTLSKFNIFDFEIRRFKNGKGTNFGLGINVTGDFLNPEPNSIYIRYGFIKRTQISEKFHFFRSWDLNLVAEDSDGAGRPIGKIGFSGLAVTYSPGLQYDFNSRISISTEGTLFLGLASANEFSGDGPKIRFIPPVGLFLHVKL
jgi:hypothetical protein